MSDTAAEIIEGEDISKAFARIEDELLASMMRNLERHTVDEAAEGFQWTQWQAYQIAELERYARANGLRYGPEFDRLNSKMEEAIRKAYESGRSEAEADMLLFARFMGDEGAPDPGRAQGFLRMPKERMDALVRATHEDMMRAEYATLRKAEDIYRRTIFDAQVYATSGAGTYAKAIDMATRDFVAKGVNGIRYRNGSWHGIEEYSRMAVRTATKRAAMVAEGDARKDWGVHTIFVNYRVDACPECMEWMGRILIDDVYGGGTAEESKSTGYPLLSDAMAQGLFHPNCRDTSSTYFEGVSELPEKPTKREKLRGMIRESYENDLDRAEDDAERYRRLEHFSLDMEDRRHYAELADDADQRAESIMGARSMASKLEAAGVSPEHAAQIADIAQGVDGKPSELFSDALDELQLHKAKGAQAFYDFEDRHITVNMEATAAGSAARSDKAPFQTFFHEFGHFLDNRSTGYGEVKVKHGRTLWRMSDDLSHRMGLGETVKREVGELLKSIKAEHGFGSISYAKEFLTNEVFEIRADNPMRLGGITDIFQGATNSTCCYSWWTPNHRKDYYSGESGLYNLSAETFAHFFECTMANPEGLETLRHYLPESYELFLKILEAM